MRVLVTGSAGFVGFHVARRLLRDGAEVVGVDAMTTYYDPALKRRRHDMLSEMEGFERCEFDLADADRLRDLFGGQPFDVVIHLAAQAGVRYSLENPRAYIDANIIASYNLLECLREKPARHAIFASTSSVYGANRKMPFSETDRSDHALTLYAATKKAVEDIAHCFAHLWGQPITVVRFFSVYGPWGRPDMALYKFTKAIFENSPLDLYNGGDMRRDFTYIDDLVESIMRLVSCVPDHDAVGSSRASLGTSPAAPYRVVNIGNSQPVGLMTFLRAIEESVGRKATCIDLPMQKGDVPETFADTSLLLDLTGYRPSTNVEEGVRAFVDWYREYHFGDR
ncbi:NAD-dependent epimerase/dehydratase family protein [Methylobacterium planeticum]|uniref:NAD-dependent epimerase/dehydratase family protein n=1 Tax=Methylobacterium planeticum TaxID=2615211 RepID=A0A6N6MNT3_9HYPH|nr:NAD-dependent epimerase/dehydratase family protein [Methylobacterium planeticum]KAB1070771.1 NAD-dependent epimerase/dehydratase family protein [Methylobacterium planeticum]